MAADEGIEFLLELDAKLTGAAAMVKALTQVENAAMKTDGALKKTEKGTGFLGRTIKTVGGAIGSFAKASLAHLTALATFEGLKRLGNSIYELGREALMAAGEAERTRKSFRLLMGEGPGDELLDFLDRIASKTEFTDGALKGFALQLTRAGFAGDGLERALAATLDLAALAPDKMAGAAEALSLLSKVRLKGGVNERELVSAGLSPQRFFERVAKDMGIGVKKVEEKIRDGKIKTGVLLEALYSEIVAKTGKAELGAAGVGMSTTFLAQLEKAKDIIPNLFEELEKSGGLKSVTESLMKLGEAFSPESAAGKAIIGTLDGMLNRFGTLISEIDFDKWGNRAVKALEFLEGAFIVTGQAVEVLFTAFEGFAFVGEKIGEFVFDAVQAYDRLVQWWTDVVVAADRFITQIQEKAVAMGRALWQGIKDGIAGGVTAVVDTVAGLGQAIVGKLKGVLGIRSPSAVFAQLGVQSTMGFMMGIEHTLPDLTGALAAAFDPLVLMHAIPTGSTVSPVIEVPSAPMGPMYGPPAAEAGGNTIRIDSLNVTVAAGAAPTSDRQDVAEQARQGVMLALQDALELLGAQGGA